MFTFPPLTCLRRGPLAATVLVALTLTSGCSTTGVSTGVPSSSWSTADNAPPERDYRSLGTANVVREEIDGVAVDQCRAEVVRHRPIQGGSDVPLIFAHGFLRSVAQHEDFARHLASWGVTTYLVGLCSGGWNRDGAATYRALMVATADESRAAKVIYGGFSAGGFAAGLAALADMRSVGYLALDSVDRAALARAVNADTVRIPVYGVFAPASRCNAQQVGARMFEKTAGAVALEVVGATHCHFEAPSNLLCSLACGDGANTAEDNTLRARILALATAYVRWRAGLDETAGAWWQPSAGVLTALPRQ
jgi:pimeloyl-ACP methyl ester carboxylesterase